MYVRTEDWKVLQTYVAHLEQRAKDLQESSWPLSEDDTTVISDLDSLVGLLVRYILTLKLHAYVTYELNRA